MITLSPKTLLVVCSLTGVVTTALATHRPIVYAMDNDSSANKVHAWRLESGGNLTSIGAFQTGGQGTGTKETPGAGPVDGIDPLGSQGSLTAGFFGHALFACNAGSSTLSVFRVMGNGGLQLLDEEDTLGHSPVSVTSWGRLVYVANVNDPDNGQPSTIVGFKLHANGQLVPIEGSITMLSGAMARPSQVSISPLGGHVVVTERGTNVVSVFRINNNGTLSNLMSTASPTSAPFGFDWIGFRSFVVSEAADGAPGASTASSYKLGNGMATIIDPAVQNGQTASCWVTASPSGRRAYVSNTGSNTVTTYGVSRDGMLTVRQAAVATDGDGSGPIDAGINWNGRFFFQLLGGKGTIAVYSTNADGDLNLLGVRTTGLPMLGTQGLAVIR